MATTRKKTIGVRAPDDENEVTAPHQGVDASDLSDDVEKVLVELGEAASAVIVWRMDNGKPVYIARIPASEYTNEYLKTEFGGGDYKIVIVDATQGAFNPVFLSIDKRFPGRSLAATVPAPASSDSAFKDQLLQLLLVKMIDNSGNKSSDLDTVLRVAEVFKGGGTSDVAGQVALLMQTATTLANSMNPPDGLAGVASQFLPVVSQIAANMQPARTVVPAARRLPPTTTTPPATPAAATVTANPPTTEGAKVAGTITPAWLAPFKTVAPMLVTLADAGSDPTVYADVAIDQASGSEALFAAAVESMNGGKLLADLFALAPGLQQTEKRKAFAAELVARIEEGLRDLLSTPDGAVNNG